MLQKLGQKSSLSAEKRAAKVARFFLFIYGSLCVLFGKVCNLYRDAEKTIKRRRKFSL